MNAALIFADTPHPTNRATVTTGEWALILGAQVAQASGGETTRMVDSIARQGVNL